MLVKENLRTKRNNTAAVFGKLRIVKINNFEADKISEKLYITTPQEDEYDLECYNKAVAEWKKNNYKTLPFDDLYREFGIK